jgi:hypothetical protein
MTFFSFPNKLSDVIGILTVRLSAPLSLGGHIRLSSLDGLDYETLIRIKQLQIEQVCANAQVQFRHDHNSFHTI